MTDEDGRLWPYRFYPGLHETIPLACPYGEPGGRLWVRETWCSCIEPASPETGVCYKTNLREQPAADFCGYEGGNGIIWHPSIFMPRWASRITLEITEVRAQRLQEISEGDAMSEGVSPLSTDSWRNPGTTITQSTAKEEYERLWDSINSKKHPWSTNPWVWAITFKVLSQPTGEK